MNTLKIYTILSLVCLFPLSLLANKWNTPDHGYFTTQKDIEQEVSEYSDASSTIFFQGKLFNFINYNNGGKVIVRKITYSSGSNSWADTKEDNLTNLTSGFCGTAWQPAPVVFNDTLYLFVEKTDITLGYSVYDTTGNSWSAIKNGPSGCDGEFMAAFVVIDKLCLVVRDKNTGKASIYWTKDLVTWNHFLTGVDCTYETGGNYYCRHISAISKSWIDNNGKVNTKIMVAYLPSDKSVRVAEFAFDDSENIYQICDNLAANEYTYSSASLAEGSVMGDPSTGNCTQLFLKKDTKDNGYCRYRILRYQKIEGGSWTKQENNLVPQNYLWASEDLDLTAVNFKYLVTQPGVNNGKPVVKQYMCLVYRGYDDWDHPLNCAWVETDHMNFIAETNQTLNGPSDIQYLGYIEGTPPFYLNHASLAIPTDPYVNGEDDPISEVEYSNTDVSQHETELAFEIDRKVKLKVAGFSADLSYVTGNKEGHETKVTKTRSIGIHAQEEAYGYYICLAPIIYKDQYNVYDVNDHFLFSIYDFNLQEDWLNTNVPLRPGLVNGNPESYMDSTTNFLGYNMYSMTNNSWVTGTSVSAYVEIENSESETNTRSGSLGLGLELGEFLDLGVEGGFDYSLSTKMSSSNEITCTTALNVPVDTNDLVHLDYEIFWLKRTEGESNWWLNPAGQDESQTTWCLTYLVTMIVNNKGDTIQLDKKSHSTGIEDGVDQNVPIIHNRPNPFPSVTTISYTIGADAGAGGNGRGQYTTMSVFDLNGRLVANPVNEIQAPGTYEVQWDASAFPAGLYVCRLVSGNRSYVGKLVVSR
jgi:hypothetical protein